MNRPVKTTKRSRGAWAAVAGGNRLGKLRQLLVGDANTLSHLGPEHPRRHVSLPPVRFLRPEPDEPRRPDGEP
jgi:hypothetical protein